jgi:AcrR family transcriptional regulator
MPARTDAKQRLIEAAERLFALRGIDAVSLAEITAEAGLGNTGAVHYYYGGREELLEAIVDGHRAGVDQRRDELLDELEGAGAGDNRYEALVRALIEPLVEKLDDERGRAFLSIQAQRHLRPRPVAAPASRRPLALRLVGMIGTPNLPAPIAQLVSEFGLLLTYGALAQRARIERGETGRGGALDRDEFVEQLVAALVRVQSAAPAPRPRMRSRRKETMRS